MPSISACDLLLALQKTLATCGIDYEQEIKDFGQVAASEDRERGHVFDLREHVWALLASQLSNQRPWKPIAQKEEQIRKVFFDYDPGALQRADPESLEAEICSISCGNRRIRKQMRALRENIATLRRIEKDFGGLDNFVTSDDPHQIALQLSEPGPYKLKEVGYPLALEYLKNVGLRAGKPDVHVLRILGPGRLAYFNHAPSEREASELLARLAAVAGVNTIYLDNLLWLLCAKDYGEVCGATPRCPVCALRASCQYPTSNTTPAGVS